MFSRRMRECASNKLHGLFSTELARMVRRKPSESDYHKNVEDFRQQNSRGCFTAKRANIIPTKCSNILPTGSRRMFSRKMWERASNKWHGLFPTESTRMFRGKLSEDDYHEMSNIFVPSGSTTMPLCKIRQCASNKRHRSFPTELAGMFRCGLCGCGSDKCRRASPIERKGKAMSTISRILGRPAARHGVVLMGVNGQTGQTGRSHTPAADEQESRRSKRSRRSRRSRRNRRRRRSSRASEACISLYQGE
jgi:hypothetical protein